MRPVPLTLDLMIERTYAPWPDCSGVAGPAALECLYGLNGTLMAALGAGGWSFEWCSNSALGVWRVPAVLESLTAMAYPGPAAPDRAPLTVWGLLRTAMVPTPDETGDLGRLIAERIGGRVWRYRARGGEGAALISVEGVRVSDPLREPVQLYHRGARQPVG